MGFEIPQSSLVLGAATEGGDNLDRRPELREGDNLQRVRRFNCFDALVGIFVEQGFHHGAGLLTVAGEVITLADVLGAPVARALLGRAALSDSSPFTTGGIGDLGTAPSSWAMKTCDTVLILGSTMPWEEYYPVPGQARGIAGMGAVLRGA